jgi:predicted DCC family thiol-disulfide oxidoreductase YuxK
VLKAIRDHLLRIDARSLGLFRVVFGLVLIGDLFRRWMWAKELYSNEGVVPNHSHLFLQRDKPGVWSLLHAASTPGEVEVLFGLILIGYLAFTIGIRTRVFQVVALVSLVSLTGRNLLTENVGDHLAIALLAVTAFLPLGSRFSLDSVLASMASWDEKTAKELNDRRRPSDDAIQEARLSGWSPVSLAALAVLIQLAVVYFAAAKLQKGDAWRDGSAIHAALHVERWVSAAGAAARDFLGPSALTTWARAFHLAAWAIPVLIFVPLAPRLTRGLAVGLALFHGLTIGVFFSFGLYGWSLVAAAALLVPKGTWDRVEGQPKPPRRRTIIYDADCGVCLLVARISKRLDLRHNLTFQGNDDLDELCRAEGGEIKRSKMPEEVTFELVQQTVIAVDPSGKVAIRSRAIAELIQALPLGNLVAWVMRLPGIVGVLDKGYDFIAERRMDISVALGKEACGIPGLGEDKPPVDPTKIEEIAPATRLSRLLSGALRDGAVAIVLAAMLAQTAHENDLGWKLPRPALLESVAIWPRMMARWDVMGTPPEGDLVFVMDAVTQDGRSVDPFTGKEPEMDPGAMRGTGLGQLWNDYLHRIHEREWASFQKPFREYLAHGGPRWADRTGPDAIVGYDVYWLEQPIPRLGEPRERVLWRREKWLSGTRGGRAMSQKGLPLLRHPPRGR